MRRISTRLAVAFLVAALLPAVPLSVVVRDLLDRRFGPSLAVPLEEALEAGLIESRLSLQREKQTLRTRAEQIAAAPPAAAGAPDLTGETTADRRQPALVLLDDDGGVVPVGPDRRRLAARTREMLAGRSALDGIAGSNTSGRDTSGDGFAVGDLFRIGDLLVAPVSTAAGVTMFVAQPLPSGLADRAARLTEGLTLLRAVELERGHIELGFLGPFLAIYGLLILLALGLSTLLARRIVRPLEALVAATRRVGRGDLDTSVAIAAPGEVGDLVRAFDEMVSRLSTQRRELARLARMAAWRTMARTLAHEVKNPLTPILLAVQETRDSYRGDDIAYIALLNECAEIVREEVESLRRLVSDFGEFARLPRPEPRPGDLTKLMRDLATLYGEKRLAIELPAGTATESRFDGAALRRALINLIDNGLAACREAGRAEQVELSLELATDGSRIAVRDAGVGIEPENLERIFQPDFTTKSDGMGLGLAVVENIVIGHGGAIEVVSRRGEGTTFTIALPAGPFVPPTSEPPTPEQPLAPLPEPPLPKGKS